MRKRINGHDYRDESLTYEFSTSLTRHIVKTIAHRNTTQNITQWKGVVKTLTSL